MGNEGKVDVADVAFALAEEGDLLLIDVEAGNMEPRPAEFDDKRQADIAQADDGDVSGFGIDFG